MEMNKKYARTTQEQLEVYIRYIQENPEILSGKNTPVAPNRMNELWEELAGKLNGLMGPSKTAKIWKESLRNWRKQLTFRARKIRAESIKTGGGSNPMQGLSAFEEQALEAFGLIAVTGHLLPQLGFGLEDDIQGYMFLDLSPTEPDAATTPEATTAEVTRPEATIPEATRPVAAATTPESTRPAAATTAPPSATVIRRRSKQNFREEIQLMAAEDLRLRKEDMRQRKEEHQEMMREMQQIRADQLQFNQTISVLAKAMTEMVDLQKRLLDRQS